MDIEMEGEKGRKRPTQRQGHRERERGEREREREGERERERERRKRRTLSCPSGPTSRMILLLHLPGELWNSELLHAPTSLSFDEMALRVPSI